MNKSYIVQIAVTVEVDESKFDEEFMAEFREYMYPFDTVEEHMEHLAQLNARGLAYNYDFIEGYGPTDEAGIKFVDGSGEVIDVEPL